MLTVEAGGLESCRKHAQSAGCWIVPPAWPRCYLRVATLDTVSRARTKEGRCRVNARRLRGWPRGARTGYRFVHGNRFSDFFNDGIDREMESAQGGQQPCPRRFLQSENGAESGQKV